MLLCLKVIAINAALVTSVNHGQESYIIRSNLLVLLINWQNPEPKFGGESACPIKQLQSVFISHN
jgi:hypothetical protein